MKWCAKSSCQFCSSVCSSLGKSNINPCAVDKLAGAVALSGLAMPSCHPPSLQPKGNRSWCKCAKSLAWAATWGLGWGDFEEELVWVMARVVVF